MVRPYRGRVTNSRAGVLMNSGPICVCAVGRRWWKRIASQRAGRFVPRSDLGGGFRGKDLLFGFDVLSINRACSPYCRPNIICIPLDENFVLKYHSERVYPMKCRHLVTLIVLLCVVGCAKSDPVVFPQTHPASSEAPVSHEDRPASVLETYALPSPNSPLSGGTITEHVSQHPAHAPVAEALPAQQSAADYTCPMHLEIKEAAPGRCPICKMQLVLRSEIKAEVKP